MNTPHSTPHSTSHDSRSADVAPDDDVADVVVIGFGPVGATLAGLLARRGRRVVVIDRDVDLFPLPRAAHVDAEAMRILQELGCGEDMRATLVANPGMDFLTADHRVLISMRSGASMPFGWHQSNFMFQPDFERRLRRAVEESGADIRLGVGATEIEQDDHRAVVHLADGTDIRGRFVVGCDGARSFTRRVVGTTMHDLEFEEPWLVVDLVLSPDAAERASLPTHALQVCDPRRPHTVVPMPEPRFRFEFMPLAGEDPDELQRPDTVRGLLAPWLPADGVEIERSAVYTFHGLVAREWRDRRILLAGDAAHQMPPFLGQGMCSGLRDAANLAWKLDAALSGTPAELLDTYQTERDPHVRAIIEAAVSFGRIICTTDEVMAAERDAAMLAARSATPDATSEGGPPLEPLGGPLIGPGGGALSRQPRIDGVLLDDVVGTGWAVVTRTDDLVPDARLAWDPVAAVVLSAETHPDLLQLLDDRTIDDGRTPECVVIRPDRYVYARGSLAASSPPDLVTPR